MTCIANEGIWEGDARTGYKWIIKAEGVIVVMEIMRMGGGSAIFCKMVVIIAFLHIRNAMFSDFTY